MLKPSLSLLEERLDESRYHVFYRIDAAGAEIVHKKIQPTEALCIRR